MHHLEHTVFSVHPVVVPFYGLRSQQTTNLIKCPSIITKHIWQSITLTLGHYKFRKRSICFNFALVLINQQNVNIHNMIWIVFPDPTCMSHYSTSVYNCTCKRFYLFLSQWSQCLWGLFLTILFTEYVHMFLTILEQ